MVKIPVNVTERIVSGIERFQPILASAESRSSGESDTVTIITDMLAEVFGYDKYSEITAEHSIRGTYCLLATKIDGMLQLLIEVKGIGTDLKEAHVKQAVDYAAKQGLDWVVLTNGINWHIYKVIFAQPINQQLIVKIDFCALNPKAVTDVESVYLVCREGWIKSELGEYLTKTQALSRYVLGALVASEPILQVLRRELKRLSPDVRVKKEQIRSVLLSEVLKRDVTEGDQAKEASQKIARVADWPRGCGTSFRCTTKDIILELNLTIEMGTQDELCDAFNSLIDRHARELKEFGEMHIGVFKCVSEQPIGD